jgi:hypothetical protein
MRKDMSKLLCEEPRSGTRIKDRKGRKRADARIPLDEKPVGKEKGNLRRKWITDWNDSKQFGEHLGPLRRFVLSCVGRKWDGVYSEICRTMDRSSTVQAHIFQHLFDYVCTNCCLVEGVPYESDYHKHYRYGVATWKDTYVHPETGILCKTPEQPRRRWRKAGPDKNCYCATSDPMICYCKDKEGIWYECKLKVRPKRLFPVYLNDRIYRWREGYAEDYFTWDMFAKAPVGYCGDSWCFSTYGLKGVYCYEKRQLGKREIKKITATIRK